MALCIKPEPNKNDVLCLCRICQMIHALCMSDYVRVTCQIIHALCMFDYVSHMSDYPRAVHV